MSKYLITKAFTAGTLAGISFPEVTEIDLEPGKPYGGHGYGSPYMVTKKAKLDTLSLEQMRDQVVGAKFARVSDVIMFFDKLGGSIDMCNTRLCTFRKGGAKFVVMLEEHEEVLHVAAINTTV